MVNLQNTKVSVISLQLNTTDGDSQMTILLRSLRVLLRKEKESSLSMIGLFVCNLTVSQLIRSLKLWDNQHHQIFTSRFPLDKKRPQKPLKSFTIKPLTWLRLTTFTLLIITACSSPAQSLMLSSIKILSFQTSSFLIDLPFIQLQVVNNTTMVL
jgi:hypothetical protein